MRLTFLGTNGWYATRTGNTVCAVVETPRRWIVLDAGDGFHRLDMVIAGPGGARPEAVGSVERAEAGFAAAPPSARDHRGIDLFLSHFHLDHVIGLHTLPKLPFRDRLRILGQPGTRRILDVLLAPPFTARLGDVPILELAEGHQTWPRREGGGNDDGNSVREPGADGRSEEDSDAFEALPLVHSDPCWGYRFLLHEADGSTKTFTYATDTGPCDNLQRLARNADVMILECSLAPGVAPNAAWPHLGPKQAATIARDAGCGKLFLTHFAADQYPDRDARGGAQTAAGRESRNVAVAEDGLVAEF